jgi:hypothetical protein
MKTHRKLALRCHINLAGELIALFRLHASHGKAASSNYQTRLGIYDHLSAPPRAEAESEKLARRLDLVFKPFSNSRKTALGPIDARKKR